MVSIARDGDYGFLLRKVFEVTINVRLRSNFSQAGSGLKNGDIIVDPYNYPITMAGVVILSRPNADKTLSEHVILLIPRDKVIGL